MCLAVPGKVIEIRPDALNMPMGRVSFGGITKEVCFAYTPEVQVGEYVLVHVGFALSRVDEEEAHKTLAILAEMGELAELEEQPNSEPGGVA